MDSISLKSETDNNCVYRSKSLVQNNVFKIWTISSNDVKPCAMSPLNAMGMNQIIVGGRVPQFRCEFYDCVINI